MKRIGIFPHTDITYVQYLQQMLHEDGMECVIRNDNVAVAGLMERAAQTVSPELWIMDDTREAEARSLLRALDDAAIEAGAEPEAD